MISVLLFTKVIALSGFHKPRGIDSLDQSRSILLDLSRSTFETYLDCPYCRDNYSELRFKKALLNYFWEKPIIN